jgi:large subunit ribosomal protein L20
MPRSSNNVAARARRKRVLRLAKGYWGRRGTIHTVAKHAVDKALQYSYRDRRQRKRQFRRLWIARISAGARINGTSYSRLIGSLRKADIQLNRKVLADLAMNDPDTFAKVVSSTEV